MNLRLHLHTHYLNLAWCDLFDTIILCYCTEIKEKIHESVDLREVIWLSILSMLVLCVAKRLKFSWLSDSVVVVAQENI